MSQSAEKIFDVVIIGGGVIGCAILHELTHHGYRCILVEKENALVSGASSGNSGIAHTGFDATPGTLEEQCLEENSVLLGELTSYNITYRQTGAIVVAWSNDELDKLVDIERNANEVGMHDVRSLDRKELFVLEPNLGRDAVGGLLVPRESAIDSWLLPITLAHSAVRSGSYVKTSCKVLSGSQQPDGVWVLKTNLDEIRGLIVVNAAGLHGDSIEGICQKPEFSIKPRKGQFAVYSKDAGELLQHIILPIPSERTKGVAVFKSAYGNLVVGPTAEDCDERDTPSLSSDVTRRLVAHGQRIIPGLSRHNPIAVYAGLRPATEYKDYQLYANPDRRWVTAAGIRSTGVSSCLAIGKRVRRLIESSIQLDPVPSVNRGRPKGVASWWPAVDGSSVVMDGIEYEVTHPLSRLGLSKSRL